MKKANIIALAILLLTPFAYSQLYEELAEKDFDFGTDAGLEPLEEIGIEEEPLLCSQVDGTICDPDKCSGDLVGAADSENCCIGICLSEIPKKQQYCSTIKDGYCDTECIGMDLDCQCGDRTCQYHENHLTCPVDCAETPGYTCTVIKDGICDPRCPIIDADCAVESYVNKTLASRAENPRSFKIIKWGLAAVLVILVLYMVYILKKSYVKR